MGQIIENETLGYYLNAIVLIHAHVAHDRYRECKHVDKKNCKAAFSVNKYQQKVQVQPKLFLFKKEVNELILRCLHAAAQLHVGHRYSIACYSN